VDRASPEAIRVRPRLRALLLTWEFGVVVVMALLYLAGIWINSKFWADTAAFHAVLRDASQFGVIAVGMSFVLINKDLDLSVGSTMGLTAAVFSILYAPGLYDTSAWFALAVCLGIGLAVGLINGLLVTWLQVPTFIATLSTLFIGRGLVLAMTGGKNIGFAVKAQESSLFAIGERNALDFSNQIAVFLVVALIGGIVLARTRWGYETYATGGNLSAASLRGINTDLVRIRAFVISSLCAVIAGLLAVAQQKGTDSQTGFGAELIVIAAVIVGGTSILGGRGRIVGSVLGAVLIVLIDKLLREGIPTTRTIVISGREMAVQAMAQLPPGAVPAFLGMIVLAAVLIEPWVIRRRLVGRIVARLRGLPPPPEIVETAAGETVKTQGVLHETRAAMAGPLGRLFAQREVAAVLFAILLWLVGFYLRPDFWGSLDNSFNLLLAFTEVGLMAVGMAYVIANGDIDLSVGSVLALSGGTAAFLMVKQGMPPLPAATLGFLAGVAAGVINGFLSTKGRLPSFVVTLGMFYIARGLGAWLAAGRQLQGFPESFNLIGRKLVDVLTYVGMAPTRGTFLHQLTAAISTQTLVLAVVALVFGLILWRTPFGYMVKATGGNRRAAAFAGIDTDRVRFLSLVLSAACAALAGVIYIAYYRSFLPLAGQLRELDVIASVIIGGGSIFGGYGSVLGALAGAAVITLLRGLMSLQIITADGRSFVMPQHWVNVGIGVILIVAVLSDIWLRQQAILQRAILRFRPAVRPIREAQL
jgi:ribose transport system permease protein